LKSPEIFTNVQDVVTNTIVGPNIAAIVDLLLLRVFGR
jgi:hypothetical protein